MQETFAGDMLQMIDCTMQCLLTLQSVPRSFYAARQWRKNAQVLQQKR